MGVEGHDRHPDSIDYAGRRELLGKLGQPWWKSTEQIVGCRGVGVAQDLVDAEGVAGEALRVAGSPCPPQCGAVLASEGSEVRFEEAPEPPPEGAEGGPAIVVRPPDYNEEQAKRFAQVQEIIRRMREFVDLVYLPDTLAIAGFYKDWTTRGEGVGNFMTYGEFPGAGGMLGGQTLGEGASQSRTGSTSAPVCLAGAFITRSGAPSGSRPSSKTPVRSVNIPSTTSRFSGSNSRVTPFCVYLTVLPSIDRLTSSSSRPSSSSRLKARLRTPEKHLCCVGTSATLGSTEAAKPLVERRVQRRVRPHGPCDPLCTAAELARP